VTQNDIIWQQGDKWRLEREGDTAWVTHPGAVVLVALLGDQLLLIEQYRRALKQTILEVPAGTRGWDEPWLACAQRELREETGYRAGKLVEMGEIWPAPGISDELMKLYLATDLTHDPLPQDDDEEIEIRPIPFTNALDMALSGKLHDAKTIVALLWANRYRQANG
jgi:ADP-ribose pyrophosphatase